jgi:crotonobetainyl-CoA:carnitine CoA-transferase CaiB-like acyl-CoA transferase
VGRPEWAEDERFSNLIGLLANGPEIVPELREIIAQHDLTHWGDEFDAAGLIWAPVAELPEVIEDPSLRDAGAFATINHPTAGAIETVAAPFDIRGAGIEVRGPAPALGQHTREVFEEAGIAPERIDDLVARGVLRQR